MHMAVRIMCVHKLRAARFEWEGLRREAHGGDGPYTPGGGLGGDGDAHGGGGDGCGKLTSCVTGCGRAAAVQVGLADAEMPTLRVMRHGAPVTCCAYAPHDQSRIASGGGRLVIIWDLSRAQPSALSWI